MLDFLSRQLACVTRSVLYIFLRMCTIKPFSKDVLKVYSKVAMSSLFNFFVPAYLLYKYTVRSFHLHIPRGVEVDVMRTPPTVSLANLAGHC